MPSPLDSPPFPNTDWGYGGSPDIGAPDGNVYPLMTALKHPNARTKIYGWVEPSINFSTSGTNNFPLSYDIFPNKIELNQAVIYVERLPNTVQMEIVYTEPAVKGDTQSRVMKPAKLQTGAEIKVPIFVAQGDRIAISTQTREYAGRVDK